MILWMHTTSPYARAGEAAAGPARMTPIPAGLYRPLFARPDEPKEIEVKPFMLGTHPVTNGEFLAAMAAGKS